MVEKAEKPAPEKGPGLRTFNVFVDDEYFEVGVEAVDGAPVATYVQPRPASAPVAPKPAVTDTPKKEAPKARTPEAVSGDGSTVIAPMPGMVVRYEKQPGDAVAEGETVVILEAMKMENAIKSQVRGTIKSINFSSGDTVAKNDVLCVIE